MEIDAPDQQAEQILSLKARAANLEQRLAEQEKVSTEELLHSELRLAAFRAGMIDLDGIKLIDPISLKPNEHGVRPELIQVLADLRRDKPWLFASATSGSVVTPPASSPHRRKLATDMTMEEWRSARSELLRRR